jgi:cell division protein ZapD
MDARIITYEQPLNELMRFCLRLEYLFAQAQYHLSENTIWDVRAALGAIIDILNVIDRPDIKSKITNALQLHCSTLIKLEQSPGIDSEKLGEVLQQLNESQEVLLGIHGKLGQNLRDNEFLTAIRQRLINPAGTCDFAIPAYHLWLQQPVETQRKELLDWYYTFDQLQGIINLLLQLTRDSAVSKGKVAIKGFYQEALSPNIPYQIIRINLPLKNNIYPNISFGKHLVSIYMFSFNGSGYRAAQFSGDISFDLTLCRL